MLDAHISFKLFLCYSVFTHGLFNYLHYKSLLVDSSFYLIQVLHVNDPPEIYLYLFTMNDVSVGYLNPQIQDYLHQYCFHSSNEFLIHILILCYNN